MKRLYIYIYMVLASMLVVASCEKPTGEAPKPPAPKQWHVSTVAGSGTRAHKDAKGEAAQFDHPRGIAVSSDGTLYVADRSNHRIRKIDTSGGVTTVAGGGTKNADGGYNGAYLDDKGTAARFNYPSGIAVSSDRTLYVADRLNDRIRKIDTSGGVTTIAGSTDGHKDAKGEAAQFNLPYGVAVTSDGTLYVADTFNHRIRKIDTSGGVTTVAGGGTKNADGGYDGAYLDGKGTAARFNHPVGIAVSPDGTLYVADTDNHRIRKIDTSGDVMTIAGSTDGHKDAKGEAAQFSSPEGIAVSSDGTLYVADTFNHRIRKIDTSGGVTTVAGSTGGIKDAAGGAAQFSFPRGIAVSSDGNTLYVADSDNHRIRKIEFR